MSVRVRVCVRVSAHRKKPEDGVDIFYSKREFETKRDICSVDD